MIHKPLKIYRNDLERLINNKSAFIVEKTHSTSIIKVLDKNEGIISTSMYSPEHTPLKVLSLMQKIKKEVRSNEKIIKDCPFSENPFDIDYFSFKESLYEMKMEAGAVYEFDNVLELDITKAYYNAALNLKFISKKMFDECTAIDKKHRLKVLGSLATSKLIYKYDNGKIVNDPIIKEDELLRSAWFKICSYTDNAMKCMKDCFKENFLFYWVDGIYLTNVYEGKFSKQDEKDLNIQLNKMKKKFHFDWVIVKLDKVEFVNTGQGMLLNVYKNKEVRPFMLPKKKIVYYGMGTEREFLN